MLALGVCNVTTKGQVTIPIDMRKELGINNGGKVIFLKEGNKVYLANASMVALKEVQQAFAGEAERLNLNNEKDVVDMVNEIRQELWEERKKNANNA